MVNETKIKYFENRLKEQNLGSFRLIFLFLGGGIIYSSFFR